ncbi:MAG: histidine phosphatase family protein [Actinomycetota bacterium]
MSHLFVVRHGQASFLEQNYDKLSAKGEEQSRLLGKYWATHKLAFDRAYCGPRVRQRETARIAGEAYKEAGLRWPDVEVIDAFDEFRAEAVIEHALPALVEADPRIRGMYQEYEKSEGQAQRFKTFQRMFEVVVGRWAAGELHVPGIEPWRQFCERVQSGLATLTGNGNRGRRIAIFTSGGPTGVAMQRALNLSTEATLKAAWMVANSAYSQFIFSGSRFTLSSYNSYPHITDREFFTYR